MKRLIVLLMLIAAVCSSSWVLPSGANATVKCTAHKVIGKTYWTCITPGSYCPKAAHKKYGYAKVTHKKYRCSWYKGDRRWHWKKVATLKLVIIPTIIIVIPASKPTIDIP